MGGWGGGGAGGGGGVGGGGGGGGGGGCVRCAASQELAHLVNSYHPIYRNISLACRVPHVERHFRVAGSRGSESEFY